MHVIFQIETDFTIPRIYALVALPHLLSYLGKFIYRVVSGKSILYFSYLLAAACGRRSCVEWLISNVNSAGNERNKLGSSPLHVAAQNGHLEVVKVLMRG